MPGGRKHGSSDYNHLLPMGSDSEDDDFGDEQRTETDNTGPNIQDAEVGLIHTNLKNGHGHGYNFRQSARKQDPMCTPTRGAVMLALSLLFFGVGYIAGFFTPFSIKQKYTPKQLLPKRPSVVRESRPWHLKLSDWGSESSIRLVDVDGDGILDVLTGLAVGKDITEMVMESTMDKFCAKHGMETPCGGAVIALRGYDGKLLWQTKTYSEIFAMNCHGVDVNQDGLDDCIVSGRLKDLRAIDPKTGKTLWVSNPDNLRLGWNIYTTTPIPDMNNDGINEIVISHGGDPIIAADNHKRHSGRLIMINGATGQIMGRYLDMPEDKEMYISPVVHQRRDGSMYILYGSGGETVGGLFLAISVPDFYRYVNNLDHSHKAPIVGGQYKQWGYRKPNFKGEIELYRSETNGVMVPPVLVDINKDGVKDILMSAFDGNMILFDGETLDVLWKINFGDKESYSSPAPGYFNDDDTLDFMFHWSGGAWPYYNSTDVIVVDGKDGVVLWNTTSHRYDVSSDLVARTSSYHRDVFLFRMQGRKGDSSLNQAAIHGATGAQRVINRRSSNPNELEETIVDDNNFEAPGLLLPESHFTRRRRAVPKDFIECESDQTLMITELFAMDRTVMKAPIKLWEKGSEKHYYKLTDEDRKSVQKVVKTFGDNHTLTELEVPWTRGKRQAPGTMCVMVQPDERTTGAIGDVDGDGKLDVIVNLISVGILRDDYAHFVKMKFDVDIYKFSLEDIIDNEMYTPLNVTIHERMRNSFIENKITNLKFLPPEKQTWGEYMGTLGNSVYEP
ncbi:protein FAM234B-like [Mytilus trossulus]|uniref:protein FAM234B-like n=1 Tax=Mytilus trossulus TaxID=6551 RepID=UPI0030063559